MPLENLQAMSADLNMNEEQLRQLAVASGRTYDQMNALDPDSFLELVETFTPRQPRPPPQPMEQNHEEQQQPPEAEVQPAQAPPAQIQPQQFGDVSREISSGIKDLHVGLQSLSDHFKTVSLKERVPTFDGSGGSVKFHAWLKAMTRTRTMNSLNDGAMKELATLTTRGTCSDYLLRVLETSKFLTWDTLVRQLKERYSNSCDSLLARQALANLRQGNNESIQSFAERIMSGADEAYTRDQMKSSIVLDNVLRVFIKGIKDVHIARTMIRKKPRHLEEALKLALEMQRNNITFEITRGTSIDTQETRDIQPMDVSQITSKPREEQEMEEDGFQDALWDQVEQLADRQDHTLRAVGTLVDQQEHTQQTMGAFADRQDHTLNAMGAFADRQDHTLNAIGALCEKFDSFRETEIDDISEESEEQSEESEEESQDEEEPLCAFIEKGTGAAGSPTNRRFHRGEPFRKGFRKNQGTGYDKTRPRYDKTDSSGKRKTFHADKSGDRKPSDAFSRFRKRFQGAPRQERSSFGKTSTERYPRWGNRQEHRTHPTQASGNRFQKTGEAQTGHGNPLKWDPVTGQPICARCGLPGHTRKECRVKLATTSSAKGPRKSFDRKFQKN